MEPPLYSAVVRVVRHRALLDHFLKTMVCGQRRFNDEFGHAEKQRFSFMLKNDRIYAA